MPSPAAAAAAAAAVGAAMTTGGAEKNEGQGQTVLLLLPDDGRGSQATEARRFAITRLVLGLFSSRNRCCCCCCCCFCCCCRAHPLSESELLSLWSKPTRLLRPGGGAMSPGVVDLDVDVEDTSSPSIGRGSCTINPVRIALHCPLPLSAAPWLLFFPVSASPPLPSLLLLPSAVGSVPFRISSFEASRYGTPPPLPRLLLLCFPPAPRHPPEP